MLGLAIAGYFVHVGPFVSTPPVPLPWSPVALDATELEVEFTVSGVDFGHARDPAEPARSFVVLSRGEQRLAFDDCNFFHAVERRGRRIDALCENGIEGPGPSLELLVSDDDGLTFEHRASIPKPNYQASFEGWTIEGDELRLVGSLEEAAPLWEQWCWPWDSSLGPGRFVLRSKNAGRTWRLER